MNAKLSKNQPPEPYRVVLLFSGGLDSLACLSLLLSAPVSQVESVKALMIDYGQSNAAELEKAKAVCEAWRVPFVVQRLSLSETDAHREIPGRNLVFIAHAFALAQAEGFNAVSIGADPDDIYPDSSSPFLVSVDQCLHTLGNYSLLTPVKYMMSKQAVVRAALSKGAPLHLCHSSYSDKVDGKCRPSKAFLGGLAEMIPIPPDEALRRIRAFHSGQVIAPERLLGGPSLDPRFDDNLLQHWSLKQAFSMLPPPRHCLNRVPPLLDHLKPVASSKRGKEALRSRGYAVEGIPDAD